MASKTDIANMALSHLGNGKEVADIDSEADASQEARTCRRFYDTCLKAVLRDFAWPFANKMVSLDLVEEDPTDEWAYSYQYPNDCVRVHRILSGVLPETRQSRVPYRIVSDTSTGLIYCNIEDAEAEYTYLHTNPTFYPADFELALSFRLAAYLAPRLTGGDPFKLGERCMQKYMLEIRQSTNNAANEEQPMELPDSEFTRERG